MLTAQRCRCCSPSHQRGRETERAENAERTIGVKPVARFDFASICATLAGVELYRAVRQDRHGHCHAVGCVTAIDAMHRHVGPVTAKLCVLATV
jgi:hypothetical protein